jgi:chromosome segregation ATPase
MQTDEALQEAKRTQEKLLALTGRLDRSDKAIAQLVQKQEEDRVSSESIKGKLKVLEDWAERGTQQMVDLQAFGERLREEQVQLVEQLRAVDDRRKKQIDGWAKEMTSWRQEVEKLREKLALMDKQYRSAEKMLAALDELKSQLEQDRETLEHVQHAGEERQRQQLEEWRKENQMLWLRNDERWQQLSEENTRRDGRVALLWESQTEHLRRQVKELARWIKEFDKREVRSKK